MENLSPTRRAAVQELFRRGDLSFLNPSQQSLLQWMDEGDRPLSVICTSRQWGKTITALSYAINFCIQHPRSSVLMLAPHKVQLSLILQQKIQLVFSYLPDDLVPESRTQQFAFANGSILRFDGISVGAGNRIRGSTADLIIIDECRDVPNLKQIIDASIAPLLTTTDGKLILISTPPDSPIHDLTDYYIKTAIATDSYYAATYMSNPLLTTKRLRYLLNTQYPGGVLNETFRREYGADYTIASTSQRVISEYSPGENEDFFAKYKGPPTPVRMYTSLDYAFRDPCAILVGYYDYNEGSLILEEEHFERGMNTDSVGLKIREMERDLRKKLPGCLPDPVRVMDIDPSLMNELYRKWDLRFEAVYKGSKIGMLNRLRVALAEGRIRVRPACKNLIFQFQAGVFNAKGDDYLRTDKGGHLDLIDAAKYANLNLRVNEVLTSKSLTAADVGPGQMWIGPRPGSNGSFRAGLLQRPGG